MARGPVYSVVLVEEWFLSTLPDAQVCLPTSEYPEGTEVFFVFRREGEDYVTVVQPWIPRAE